MFNSTLKCYKLVQKGEKLTEVVEKCAQSSTLFHFYLHESIFFITFVA